MDQEDTSYILHSPNGAPHLLHRTPAEFAPKVFVSGCYDMLHSGHVAFFKEAAQYGDLYVGIGSDCTIQELKHRRTVYSEKERLYMVKAIRYVTDAFINDGSGMMDFVGTVDRVKPDVFVVNTDGGSEQKRQFCAERGIRYVELERIPEPGLEARSTTALRKTECQIPTRIDIAGTWIDQPYVSQYHPGWAITVSIEPTFDIPERCGLSTSTRNMIRKIWPYQLPDMHPEMLAKLSFCFENEPVVELCSNNCASANNPSSTEINEQSSHNCASANNPTKSDYLGQGPIIPAQQDYSAKGGLSPAQPDYLRRSRHVSGAQDAIGICMPGLVRHYYDNCYWPTRIESCHDEKVLSWLESHLCLVPMFPRRPGTSVVEGKDITTEKVKALADAAERCWHGILAMDLERTVEAYRASFEAQIAMFPAMMQPGVSEYIDDCKAKGALAWKMCGAGGGGYLALLVSDVDAFTRTHPEGIGICVRRK